MLRCFCLAAACELIGKQLGGEERSMKSLKIVFLQKNKVSPVFPVQSSFPGLRKVCIFLVFWFFGFCFFFSLARSLASHSFVFVTDQENVQ